MYLLKSSRTYSWHAWTSPLGLYCSSIPVVSIDLLKRNALILTRRYDPAWSITMASYSISLSPSTHLAYLGLFGLGSLIMRGAGCTINDMWDRKLDKAVGKVFHPLCAVPLSQVRAERTKTRPMASGNVSPTQATAFLGLQLTAGLGVLTQLNWYRCVLSHTPNEHCQRRIEIALCWVLHRYHSYSSTRS